MIETRDCYIINARYNDPMVGRFISDDPAKDGWNWYGYCKADPIKLIDLSGTVTREAVDSMIIINYNFIKISSQEIDIWLTLYNICYRKLQSEAKPGVFGEWFNEKRDLLKDCTFDDCE